MPEEEDSSSLMLCWILRERGVESYYGFQEWTLCKCTHIEGAEAQNELVESESATKRKNTAIFGQAGHRCPSNSLKESRQPDIQCPLTLLDNYGEMYRTLWMILPSLSPPNKIGGELATLQWYAIDNDKNS